MKTIAKHSISLETAQAMLAAAQKKAEEMQLPVSIAIIDESYALKAFASMDKAAPSSISIAQDKAYTAAAFTLPTHHWYDYIKDDGALLNGIPNLPRVVIIGGGFPIIHENAVIGAIGVAGGLYTQDMDVAQAALAILQ